MFRILLDLVKNKDPNKKKHAKIEPEKIQPEKIQSIKYLPN